MKTTTQVLAELRSEFPALSVEARDDGVICVSLPGQRRRCWVELARQSGDDCGWVVNEKVKRILPNAVVFNEVEVELLARDASTRGAYLVVNGPDARSLHETCDSAFRGISSDASFVGIVGVGLLSDE